MVEPTGAEIQITGEAAGHPMIAVPRDRIPVAPGDEIRLATRFGNVHLFDPDPDPAPGRRIAVEDKAPSVPTGRGLAGVSR